MVQLATLTAPQLLLKYNAAAARLGRKPVNRFADLKTALRRTKEILAVSPDAPEEAEAAPKAKELKLVAPKSRRTKGYNFPLRKTLKKLNKGTIREAIFQHLATNAKDGVTEESVRQVIVTWKKSKGEVPNMERLAIDTYEHIRNLHLYVGYGLQQGEDGLIHILLPEAK